jgi:cytochrome o ubiquinol oxidase subunit I
LRRLPLWRRRFPEKVTAASSDLLFFELELNRLDDERAAKVAARPLKHYQPWLEDIRKGTWAAVPLDQPIPMIASGVVGIIIIGVLIWITLKGWLPYLWREWITSVDHKRIGIMYILLAMVMLLRGFSDAIMMRSQQALAFQSPGYLPPEHYDQIFSAHGTLMIFFVAMPFVIGLMNCVVPLQLGVRDVAFPTLNSVSFWLTATGALLVNISLVVGEFARRDR